MLYFKMYANLGQCKKYCGVPRSGTKKKWG